MYVVIGSGNLWESELEQNEKNEDVNKKKQEQKKKNKKRKDSISGVKLANIWYKLNIFCFGMIQSGNNINL